MQNNFAFSVFLLSQCTKRFCAWTSTNSVFCWISGQFTQQFPLVRANLCVCNALSSPSSVGVDPATLADVILVWADLSLASQAKQSQRLLGQWCSLCRCRRVNTLLTEGMVWGTGREKGFVLWVPVFRWWTEWFLAKRSFWSAVLHGQKEELHGWHFLTVRINRRVCWSFNTKATWDPCTPTFSLQASTNLDAATFISPDSLTFAADEC